MKAAVLYSEGIKEYDLGHILKGDRFDHCLRLFHQKLGKDAQLEIVEPPSASFEDLTLIHSAPYVARVESLESLDPLDTPLSEGLIRAAKLLAGAGKFAGELVQSGAFQQAFVVGGGVQHASRSQEKGFGVFSDVGICAANLLVNFGLQRILILDTDAHAGDGLYEIFVSDPRVLFLSLHQDPGTLYPGKGFSHEIGRCEGIGFSVNVPLSVGSGDAVYDFVLQEVFVPLANEFRPEIILMVDGSDPHFSDRITQMGMTLQGIRNVGARVRQTADELCEGRMVDFIGSGYSFDPEIVCLGWLASMAGVTGIDLELPEPCPISWTRQVEERTLVQAEAAVRSVQKALAPYWRCFAHCR